ncbi:hypothetical protein D3C75_562410 [compost metagenome]
MTEADSPAPSDLKTAGFTPFLYLSDQPLFHVCRNVPIADALAQDSNRHAWAAHYLTTMSKAVIDDVVKVLTRRPVQMRKEADPSKNT